ncbi:MULTISPECIES: pirin family protein [unclassified Pseudoalteromonas]|uniref:pirin family protein n=1 Tax=unclassified Pseudoalteromonas TaxID=194690 RepID=UPI0030143D52
MSNLSTSVEQDCSVSNGCSAIKLVLTPKDKELGGFTVRRSIPVKACRSIGPWVFFDHMGPAQFTKGQGVDVRPHPHIGLATVTYLFEGEMLHRDSLGTEQVITPGAVNLMVAGRGIVHSERQREEIKAAPQRMHGLQLWLALPEHEEQCEPDFLHYPGNSIPSTLEHGVAIRVLIGSAYGITSPVKTFSETLYLEARLQAGQTLTLPETDELGVYVVKGKLTSKDTQLNEHTMAVFSHEASIQVTAQSDTILALIGGRSLGKRYMDWNFVASDKALIDKAKHDWQAGHFAKVPNDDQEFIPLPG